ncbi:MAG: hypothetical protein ACR2LQ_07635 [Acidimicrobiales bacterium]
MRGRLLLGAALGACAIVAMAPAAQAYPSNWYGGWDDPPGGASAYVFTDGASHVVKGVIGHNDSRPITVYGSVSGEAPAGCEMPRGFNDFSNVGGRLDPKANYFTIDLAPECNGTYTLAAYGTVDSDPFVDADTSPTHTATVDVKRPAPEVSGVAASAGTATRSVVVSWDSIAGPGDMPKDLTGFIVSRTDQAGHTTTFAPVTDPSSTSFADTSVPAAGGTFTYAVSATRFNVEPSAASPAAVIKLDKAADSPSTTAPGDGTAVAPGTGAATTPGAATGGARRSGAATRGGATASTQPGEPDPGFESDLPYEAEPGAVASALPSGGSEGGINVAGAGILIPFAVALVLAVWGMHVLYVTKSARDADDALTLLHLEFE